MSGSCTCEPVDDSLTSRSFCRNVTMASLRALFSATVLLFTTSVFVSADFDFSSCRGAHLWNAQA